MLDRYVCMYVCTKSTLWTTSKSLCVCTHLAIKLILILVLVLMNVGGEVEDYLACFVPCDIEIKPWCKYWPSQQTLFLHMHTAFTKHWVPSHPPYLILSILSSFVVLIMHSFPFDSPVGGCHGNTLRRSVQTSQSLCGRSTSPQRVQCLP